LKGVEMVGTRLELLAAVGTRGLAEGSTVPTAGTGALWLAVVPQVTE